MNVRSYVKDQITFPNLEKKGRLGNQLFQIAATIAVAVENNLGCSFPDWEYNQFLKNPILESSKVKPEMLQSLTHFYTEPSFRYTKINLGECITNSTLNFDENTKCYALDGYFQSKAYFVRVEDLIKKHFLPNVNVVHSILRKNPFTYADKCAVHVRRGDYVNNNFYHQLGMDYYERSMKQIEQETGIRHFVIFSDDINWCKLNFNNPNVY